MASIFSTQNLQTFLRRKYLRPPSRPPPGPPGRGGRRSRSPYEGRSPEGRSPPAGRSPPELTAVALISSAMMLLKNQSLVLGRWSLASVDGRQDTKANDQRRRNNDQLRCNRCRFSAGFCDRGGGGLALRVADRLDLIQTLLLLIDAHGDEFDHRFGDTQAAFQSVNQPAATLHCQQHVNAVVKPADHVGQAALAHLLNALYVSA